MGWLVFSNLYVATCGAMLTAATFPLLGLPPRLDATVAIVFFGTLLIYNLDRLVEPKPGHTQHEQWVATHRRPLWGLTIASAAGCAMFAFVLPPPVWWSLGIAAAVSVGYCLPIYRSGGTWRRLKALPGAKLLLIAGVWTYATAGLAMLAMPHSLSTSEMINFLAGRLLFLLAVALPFDVPDTERDKAAGITTLPQRFGLTGARNVALLLAGGFALLSVFSPWPYAAALLVSAALTLGLLAALSESSGVFYYEVMLDGLLLIQAGLLLLIWAGTGEPV